MGFLKHIKETATIPENTGPVSEKDIKRLEDAKDYISWIQSFSKKIVVITFLLYLGVNLFIMIITVLQTQMGGGDISTIYTEINETFRVVIGGYLIKAAIENAFKIGGNYLVGVSDAKLKIMKENLGVNSTDENTDCPEEYEDFDPMRNDDTTV